MNARDLFHILGDIGLNRPPRLSEFKVVTKDGGAITGIQVNHERKQILLVQKDTWVENLSGTSFTPGMAPSGLTESDLKRVDL